MFNKLLHFLKASGRPLSHDALFDSLTAEKAKRAKKLLKMPEFKTLRMHMQRDQSRATGGVAFDEKALIDRPYVLSVSFLNIYIYI